MNNDISILNPKEDKQSIELFNVEELENRLELQKEPWVFLIKNGLYEG